MVKLKEVEPFSGMLAAPKALLITGAAATLMLAVAVLLVPALLVAVTLLFFVPVVVAWILSETVHDPPAGMLPFVRLAEDAPAVAVAVPPQVLLRLGVGATTRPAGKLSVNASPVAAAPVFGFWMVKVSEVTPFSGICAAPNALAMVTGEATLRLAEAVFPVPPFVDVTFPVVFVYWPEAAPVTVTLNWHWLFTAMVAPEREIPVGAVVVRVPPQTVAVALATVSPAGRVSVNATPVSGSTLAAGLVMVKVSEVVPLTLIDDGLKTLAIDGGASTLMLAEAVPPVPPSFEVTLPVVLFCRPAAVPVTFTENVHELFAATVAPDRLITFVPAVAVIVPLPQLPVRPFGVDTTSPAGSVSLNPTPVRAVALGFSDTLPAGLVV